MAVQLICCSHSPLMTTDVEETEKNLHAVGIRQVGDLAKLDEAFLEQFLLHGLDRASDARVRGGQEADERQEEEARVELR